MKVLKAKAVKEPASALEKAVYLERLYAMQSRLEKFYVNFLMIVKVLVITTISTCSTWIAMPLQLYCAAVTSSTGSNTGNT